MTMAEPPVLDGYIPPPYRPPSTLDERIVNAWREVTRTPGRAALAMVAVCSLVGAVISLRTIPVTTADAQGPLRAHCGVSFYVAGAPNHAVNAACRFAFASRVPGLVALTCVFVAATAALVFSIARPDGAAFRRIWHDVTRTPGRAALATFDLAALVAVFGASQPVTAATADAAGGLRARCGLSYYIVGAGNAAVRDACRRAYGPRASVFFVALAACVIATAVLLLRRQQRPGVEDVGGGGSRRVHRHAEV